MDVEQHKKDLENLLYLSEETQKKELSRLLGEDTFLFKLKTYLTQSVNSRISAKMKDRYVHERGYFELRNKIEDDVILSTNWYSYFENGVSYEELKQPLENFPLKTLMLIVIEALKQYVDSGEELNPKCLLLRDIYLNLKERLTSSIPNYPQEDGFVEYSKLKTHREELEDTRITGKICPSCNSTDVKSYGANWKCNRCNREFRKHRAQKDED